MKRISRLSFSRVVAFFTQVFFLQGPVGVGRSKFHRPFHLIERSIFSVIDGIWIADGARSLFRSLFKQQSVQRRTKKHLERYFCFRKLYTIIYNSRFIAVASSWRVNGEDGILKATRILVFKPSWLCRTIIRLIFKFQRKRSTVLNVKYLPV